MKASLIACRDSSAEMYHKTEPPVQCPVWLGWSSTALLCLLLIKQTIFILGGRLRLTVFIGSRRQTWFYGRRNILFYGQGFYQGGLAVWNIIQERESTNQQNYSSTIQGEGAIKTILQSKSWSKIHFYGQKEAKTCLYWYFHTHLRPKSTQYNWLIIFCCTL